MCYKVLYLCCIKDSINWFVLLFLLIPFALNLGEQRKLLKVLFLSKYIIFDKKMGRVIGRVGPVESCVVSVILTHPNYFKKLSLFF
jgi:hypothetical protein